MGICCSFVFFSSDYGPLAVIFFLHRLVFFKCEPAKKTRPQNHDSRRNNDFFSNYIDPRKCTEKRVTFFKFLNFDPKSWAMGMHDPKKNFCSLLVNVFPIQWHWL